MKLIRGIMKVLLIFIGILASIIIGSFINHKIQLSKEEDLFKRPGNIVEVNGNKMSIYTEGEGRETLVFMSGGGTCSPILDFKSLYSKLNDDYRIVVIEKFGYGFSDIVDERRDIDTILSDSREALEKAGINGPYILCPHSMSGIEVLYWAEKYPEEVKAIVGLDMAVPKAYLDYKINMPLIKLSSFAANAGITRLIPGVWESDAVKHGTLSEEEKEIYKAVFFRRTATKTMLNEVKEIKKNALLVDEGEGVNIPMLMFVSNGQGTGWSEDQWKKLQKDFALEDEKRKIVELDCPHYVHDYEYDKISKEIKKFIN